jgi:subtilisin family serine protease
MLRRELRRKAMGIRVLPRHLIIKGALTLALCVAGLLSAAGPTHASVDSTQAAVAAGDEVGEGVIVELNTELTTIEVINRRYGSTTLDDYFASIGVYLLKPPNGSDAETFERRLEDESQAPTLNGVVYAESNFVAEAPEDPTAGDGRMRARAISGLRRVSTNQYAADYLNLSCAAEVSRGEGVTVAVLDTGAQLKHPALKANFSGVTRYDFVNNDTKPSEIMDANRDGKRDPLAGHGTHVAGIVDQVAPAAKIMPLRVLNSQGLGNVYTVAKAVSYAERYETDVINLSLGSSQRSELLQEMIGHAIDRGTIVAAAAGNSDDDTPHYPAAGNAGAVFDDPFPPSTAGLLAVSSVVSYVDANGKEYERKSWFANFGEWVSVAVPGENIRSPFPRNKYANWSGTSMATPFISGQAALIRSFGEQNGDDLEPADIKSKILASVQNFTEPPKYGDPPKYEDLYAAWIYSPNDPTVSLTNELGTGHVNVCDSLQQ